MQKVICQRANLQLSDLEKFHFGNFDPELQYSKKAQGDAKEMLKLSKKWSTGKGEKFLTLSGGVGIGKTHLAKASLRYLIENMYGENEVETVRSVYYAPATEVAVKSRSFDDGLSERYRLSLQKADYLVLDDVGVEWDPRGYMQSFYHSIIDHRYNYNLNTMMTTNLSTNGRSKESLLKRLGERVVSRITHTGIGIVFLGSGEDIRRK
tara:strand:+ start:473 stop:1096 length:624 start_codon:yes stop_codon:yes gene_type:complete